MDGFKYDRRFFIQNSNGTTVTLKHNPKLHQIRCHVLLTPPELTLSAPNCTDYIIGLSEPCACGFMRSLLNMAREEVNQDSSIIGNSVVESRICGQKLVSFLECNNYPLKRFSTFFC